MRLRTLSSVGTLAMVVLALASAPVEAGCCGGGGGGYRGGGYGGGHTLGRGTHVSYAGGCGGSCCRMSMGPMGGNGMAGMNMAGGGSPSPAYPVAPAPPTAVGNTGRYTCPMHPSVVSAVPASCPYCGMALTRR